jgi:hypothetical protein
MRPGSVEWTLDEEALLRRLASEGNTAREAGDAFGRATEGVRSKGERLGLTFASGRGRTHAVVAPVKEALPTPLPNPRYSSRTAMIFGDPPIGRSALDQKLQQQGANSGTT